MHSPSQPWASLLTSKNKNQWSCTNDAGAGLHIPLQLRLFELRTLLGVITHILQVEPELELPLAHTPRELKVIVLSPYCAHLYLQAGLYQVLKNRHPTHLSNNMRWAQANSIAVVSPK